MSEIRILPSTLINQIAAGEVVERPFSVIKELVENSLDAGARAIDVEIREGGKRLISVHDDGHGMGAKEAVLSVERHATSKIGEMDDLGRISTMGFRGEALAAISAVSRFELSTCRDENEGGTLVVVEGGDSVRQSRIGFRRGTGIKVMELFFNTPARRKFLKSQQTEYEHVVNYLLRTALSFPEIRFRFRNNKKEVHNLAPVKDMAQRLTQIHGVEFARNLVRFEHEEIALKFEGMFSLPPYGRPSRRWQQVFVNRRFVTAPFIRHAVEEAYKTILMKNQHPLFFVNVEIEPAEIDVNVHPAKTEIRFRNPTLVRTILSQNLHRLLREQTRRQLKAQISTTSRNTPEPSREGLSRERIADSLALDLPARGRFTPESAKASDGFSTSSGAENQRRKQNPSDSATGSVADGTPADHTEPNERREGLLHFVGTAENVGLRPVEGTPEHRWKAIGQFNEYVIASVDETLMIVDKHAAHERVRFEEIRQSFLEGHSATHRQTILPQIIRLAPQDSVKILGYGEFWDEIGFTVEHYGKDDFKISAIPPVFQGTEKKKGFDVKEILQELLDEADLFGKSGNLEKYRNKVFEKMACHSAIRGRQSMSLPEMQSLLDQLAHLDIHLFCPHGRPVVIEMTPSELEKRFRRVV